MHTDNGLIRNNNEIAPGIWRMDIDTELSKEVLPGQFMQVQVPGCFLRRPISVCDTDVHSLTLVYRVIGKGTDTMSHMKKGDTVNLFGPLGNGFSVEDRDVLLIGGGIGVPPLLKTAEAYLKKNHKVTAVMGFNTAEEIILKEEFEKNGCDVYIATMDGSCGTKGTVLDAVKENDIRESFVLSCGPLPMLKAVSSTYKEGYISMESRMACGMGACMGCVVKDKDGNSLRVCKEGPVFPIGKVVL